MTNESKKTPVSSNLPADQLRTPSGSVSAAGRMGVPAADTGHTPQDLDQLRKIAEQATPGPWEARQSGNFPGKYVVGPRHRPGDIGRGPIVLMQPIFWDEGSVANAEFIAAFDPETVLALITRTEQAEQDRDAALDANKRWAHRSSRETSALRKAHASIDRVRALRNTWCEASYEPMNAGLSIAGAVNAIDRALDGDGRG
ncbi:ead/Ea22-like family protein [Glutamicibacter sp. NPDC087344]|uniref:ead/Ea22-like family protein n=1 Tax=Glutamicibacter sp. NPDC087344 TaxID=3363994 RepID=UPI0037FA7ED7